MGLGIYLSHPEVTIDPLIPVPQWSLSEKGRARAALFGQKLIGAGIAQIFVSTETKAMETAQIIADLLEIPLTPFEAMGENDRSATGFVPPDRFEELANLFFAQPDISVLGWETARAAQARITSAIDNILDAHGTARPFLFVGHGGVGTLLRCAMLGILISRAHDQIGQGNAFAFTLASRQVLCDWTAIEKWEQSQWPES